MKKNLIVPLAFVAIWSIMVFSSLTFASTTTVKNKSNESADHKRPILSWAIWSGNHKPFSGDFETWDRRPPFSGDFGTWDHKPFSGDFGTWDHKKPLSGNIKVVDTGMEITTELTSAVTWMHDNNLTSSTGVSGFKPNNYVTREQASKFFVLFAKNILWKTGVSAKSTAFSDVSGADKTLQSYIKESAKMWLLKGSKGKFGPFNKLSKAQAIAVLVRSLNGTQDETGTPWYSAYYTIANNDGLLSGLNFDSSKLDSTSIRRGELALILYRVVTNNLVK